MTTQSYKGQDLADFLLHFISPAYIHNGHGGNTWECQVSRPVYASSCVTYSYSITFNGSLSFSGAGCLSLIMSQLWFISHATFSGACNMLWLYRSSRLHTECISHCWHVLPRMGSNDHIEYPKHSGLVARWNGWTSTHPQSIRSTLSKSACFPRTQDRKH